VFSKTGTGAEGVKWSSEGGGEYDIAQVGNLAFNRGTKIVMHLKPSCLNFAKESEVEKIIKKYSIFNKYPIALNGNNMSNLQAIWYRDKKEVTTDEYEMFYEQLAET